MSELILEKVFGYYFFECDTVIPRFMQVLVAANDKGVAVDFWKRYLAKRQNEGRVPKDILAELAPFMLCFGSDVDVQSSLYDSVQKQTFAIGAGTVVGFVSACVKLHIIYHARLCQRMLERLVVFMSESESIISTASVSAFWRYLKAAMDYQTLVAS